MFAFVNASIITILVFLLSLFDSYAQINTVPEWKTVLNGNFAGYSVSSFAYSKDKQYFAVVSSTLGFDSSNAVYISNDEGTSWQGVLYDKHYNLDSAFMPLPGNWQQRQYQSIARPSKDLIILIVADQLKDNFDQGAFVPYILRSENGGKTWNRGEINSKPKYSLSNFLAMADENTGYLTSGSPPEVDSNISTLYKTADGGKTWQPQKLPLQLGYVRKLYALSDKEVIVATSNGMYISIDGGSKWKTGTLPSQDVYQYSFRTTEIGYAVGGEQTGLGAQSTATMYYTTNAGTTWTKMLDTLLGGAPATAISFYDANIGILFAGDVILHTNDGAKTWMRAPTPYGIIYESGKDCKMISPNRAVAVMSQKVIVATGKNILEQPVVSWKKLDTLNYAILWNPVSGANRYRIQYAAKPAEDFLSYDYEIFNTNKKTIDTVVTSTQFEFPKFKYNSDNFVRVMALGESIESGWSNQVIQRTVSAPPKAALHRPNPVFPPHDTVMKAENVTFLWEKDSNATHYSLKLTTRGNYDGAWADSIAMNVYNITTNSVTVPVAPNKTHYWYVVAHAPGFDSAGSEYYHSFKNEAVSNSIEEFNDSDFITITPNPASEYIEIKSCACAKKVEIFDATGMLVSSETPILNKVDIKNLSKGIYFLKINNRIFKFIKIIN